MDNNAVQTSYLNSRKGILSWLTTLDHKRIAVMYLVPIFMFFITGVILGMLMRLELFAPGETIMKAKTYAAFFTLHGVIMIFFVLLPVFMAGLGNFFLPIHVGANDVYFPRLNLLSWYLYMTGAVFTIITLFIGGPPDTGWTFYVPFSTFSNKNVTLTAMAVFILGMSSILTGVNFITTVHKLRDPALKWMKQSMFTWTVYATAWVQVIATPVLGITFLIIVVERGFNLGLFDPARGGDPLMYQHLFWLYSHPAVYIIILPAMGIVSEIIPVFARKAIFGYKAIVASTFTIALVGSLVWAHHMFASGMSDTAIFVFSFLTFVVAVPSAIKVFNWVATFYKGSIELSPPLLFSLFFIFLFSFGGLCGLVLGAAATDIHVHDTHFVVGHFHYVMFGGAGFAFFAALHYWLPKMTGKMYNVHRAIRGAGYMFVGFNVLYFPMIILGLKGMPRRYYDYVPRFHFWNAVSTLGSWILFVGLVIVIVNLIMSFRSGKKAPDNPWGGSTLEWKIPSPPGEVNFINPPGEFLK